MLVSGNVWCEQMATKVCSQEEEVTGLFNPSDSYKTVICSNQDRCCQDILLTEALIVLHHHKCS